MSGRAFCPAVRGRRSPAGGPAFPILPPTPPTPPHPTPPYHSCPSAHTPRRRGLDPWRRAGSRPAPPAASPGATCSLDSVVPQSHGRNPAAGPLAAGSVSALRFLAARRRRRGPARQDRATGRGWWGVGRRPRTRPGRPGGKGQDSGTGLRTPRRRVPSSRARPGGSRRAGAPSSGDAARGPADRGGHAAALRGSQPPLS